MFLKSITVLVTLTITFEASFGLNSKLKIGTQSTSFLVFQYLYFVQSKTVGNNWPTRR